MKSIKERKAEKKADELALRKMLPMLNAPIDPDHFLFCVNVGSAAARGDLHDSHIKPPSSGPGLYLTNVPINRAMLAISRESERLSDDEKMAVGWKFMHLYLLARAVKGDDRFVGFAEISDESFGFHGDVLRAYAEMEWRQDGGEVAIDLDGIYRRVMDRQAGGHDDC